MPNILFVGIICAIAKNMTSIYAIDATVEKPASDQLTLWMT